MEFQHRLPQGHNKTRTAAWNDLPQWFKRNGYWTTGMGKTFHNGVGANTKGNASDDWSDLEHFPYLWDATGGTFNMFDINNTDTIIERIKYAAAQFKGPAAKPFFIAQGYMKPHLPWVYPADIKDLYYPGYKNGSKVVPPAADPNWPTGVCVCVCVCVCGGGGVWGFTANYKLANRDETHSMAPGLGKCGDQFRGAVPRGAGLEASVGVSRLHLVRRP
jgi:hypothetical protein